MGAFLFFRCLPRRDESCCNVTRICEFPSLRCRLEQSGVDTEEPGPPGVDRLSIAPRMASRQHFQRSPRPAPAGCATHSHSRGGAQVAMVQQQAGRWQSPIFRDWASSVKHERRHLAIDLSWQVSHNSPSAEATSSCVAWMDDSTHYNWTLTYVVVLAVATVTTFTTLLLSFKQIKVSDSAVQFITYSVCRLYFVYSVARLVLYVGVLANFDGLRDTLDELDNGELMGARAIYSEGKRKVFPVAVTLVGDCALMSTNFFIITLAYEMKRLIIKSMDRGPNRERAIMRQYSMRAYGIAVVFAILMIVSAFLPTSAAETLQTVAFWIELAGIWASVLYPLYATLRISCKKRARSAVDPASLLLHQRIKSFVIVYCVLVFPSCVVEVLCRLFSSISMEWVGITQILYYMSGGGAAFAIGVSVTCCYRTLRPLMPPSVYEQLLEGGYFPEERGVDDVVEAPTRRPIFVVTDIEGSSRLWAGNSVAMAEAQSIHDDLLRQQLPRFRGYEITTAGDSFQLAFHCVRDAILWCVSVQEKLLKATWPAALLKFDNAARVYDIWTGLLFNGLRVRMAIHDGDERLVCSRHPTTGKTTYLGLSEMLAREMSEMGRGGQVILSESALALYKDEMLHAPRESGAVDKFRVQPFQTFEQPEFGIAMQMHEVISTRIGERFRVDNPHTTIRMDHLSERLRLPHF